MLKKYENLKSTSLIISNYLSLFRHIGWSWILPQKKTVKTFFSNKNATVNIAYHQSPISTNLQWLCYLKALGIWHLLPEARYLSNTMNSLPFELRLFQIGRLRSWILTTMRVFLSDTTKHDMFLVTLATRILEWLNIASPPF